MARLRDEGAASVVVSRPEEPTLALIDGSFLELAGTRFEPVHHRGGGDSMFAALGAGIAAGLSVGEALRIGLAAGAQTHSARPRTGSQVEIERIAGAVTVRELAIAERPAH